MIKLTLQMQRFLHMETPVILSLINHINRQYKDFYTKEFLQSDNIKVLYTIGIYYKLNSYLWYHLNHLAVHDLFLATLIYYITINF